MMATVSADNLTSLLIEWSEGDKTALDRLTPLVYDELRRIAHRYARRERNGHTLATTALVNEAYVRLARSRNIAWENRKHFFAATAQVMRHILIDHARSRLYAKRGGHAQHVPLDDASSEMTEQRADELLALNDALEELATFDSRKANVVEMRYFGGLSLEETAEVLDVSVMTVRRDWRAAKAWLFRKIAGEVL